MPARAGASCGGWFLTDRGLTMAVGKTILVTGGVGFIGAALVRRLVRETPCKVVSLDRLGYAGDRAREEEISVSEHYHFRHADIRDAGTMNDILATFQPDIVIHLAAETHVDRSIDCPADFIDSNVIGTCVLLDAVLRYYDGLTSDRQQEFRFHHVSTDEVYGSLGVEGYSTEQSGYRPNSPYAASKASSDHFVRAWYKTYGLPIVVTNCSNNYGPWQFPEKLIPLVILAALRGEPLPIYGDGQQVRDWLYVEDHAEALHCVSTRGAVGETYHISGRNEQRNIEVVEKLCDLLEELAPDSKQGVSFYRDLIRHIEDRPGHDQRYALDASKISAQLGWEPQENFTTGLRKTVSWYLANRQWCENVQKIYDGRRLGLREKR